MKHPHLIRAAALLLALLSLFGLSACGESKEYQSEVYAMDTIMTLTAYGPEAKSGLRAAESVIRSMNDMLDPELETSVVYAMNHANGAAVSVPGQVAKMLQTAQKVYEQSKKLKLQSLDLSVYPLVKLWGFAGGRSYYVPGDEELAEARSHLHFDQVIISSFPSSGSYEVTMPYDCELSFGAIAKGGTAAYVIEAMRNAGVTSGIISLGGNIQTLGLKPDGSKWRIGVTDPNSPDTYLGILTAGETAVVTSGSYQRNFTDQRGRLYHHIIDPRTGKPTENSLLSVTVICEDGTMADALSTALFVMGETGALRYWRAYGDEKHDDFEVILVTKSNEIICTSGLIEEFSRENEYYSLRFVE
ncbi:MAG: FAD:protein FMN transferase [Oscillospiraceae bacterium]|nr:FAD:protein FMN transferase [Oscillospiraceae bacterium]